MMNYVIGSFVRCIQLSDRKPIKLLQLIVNEFESYKDEPLYSNDKKGKYFLKDNNVHMHVYVCADLC